jgi:hypothetical protein
MKRSARRAVAAALVVAFGWAAVGAITDGTSNTRSQAGISTSPGRELAVQRKAGKGQQDYLLLAIPGVRGTGGGGGI